MTSSTFVRWRILWAVLAALPAIWMGAVVTRLEWAERPGFDVLGVAWLLMNIPNLALWFVFAFLIVLAVVCWVAIFRTRRSRW